MLVANLCLTLLQHYGLHPTRLLFMGFPRQKYWSGLPFPTPGDLLDPATESSSPESSAMVGGFSTTEPPGKPQPYLQFSSVQSLCCVWLYATPWITACQASLSITNSRSSLKLMSIESIPFFWLTINRQASHNIKETNNLSLNSIPKVRKFGWVT